MVEKLNIFSHEMKFHLEVAPAMGFISGYFT